MTRHQLIGKHRWSTGDLHLNVTWKCALECSLCHSAQVQHWIFIIKYPKSLSVNTICISQEILKGRCYYLTLIFPSYSPFLSIKSNGHLLCLTAAGSHGRMNGEPFNCVSGIFASFPVTEVTEERMVVLIPHCVFPRTNLGFSAVWVTWPLVFRHFHHVVPLDLIFIALNSCLHLGLITKMITLNTDSDILLKGNQQLVLDYCWLGGSLYDPRLGTGPLNGLSWFSVMKYVKRDDYLWD